MAATRSNNEENVETAMYSTAANFPLTRVVYPITSSYIPCFQTPLYYLNEMDNIMVFTRRWTDNCMGWVPPYSQIYISMLLYIQTLRNMEAARVLAFSESSMVLRQFLSYFRPDLLWIPGPLVSYFKNLACFPPNLTGFGNVTPALPGAPNWSQASCFGIQGPGATHLPNISVFLSRLYTVCAVAEREDMTEFLFQNDTDGPKYLSSMFGHSCDGSNVDELRVVSSPGAGLTYNGNLRLWQQAASSLGYYGFPPNLNQAAEVSNNWISFLRLDHNTNWFFNVAVMMNKYCQFWRGSCPLSQCLPNGSAAGAVCLSPLRVCGIFQPPKWNAGTGEANSNEHGNPNQRGHYSLCPYPELIFNAEVALDGIPENDMLAATTHHYNLIPGDAQPAEYSFGPFWTIAPRTHRRDDLSVYLGVRMSLSCVYHHERPEYDSDD